MVSYTKYTNTLSGQASPIKAVNQCSMHILSLATDKYPFARLRNQTPNICTLKVMIKSDGWLQDMCYVTNNYLSYQYCLLIVFVLLLLNVTVNSCGHVGMAISDFVELLPKIEMYETSSPAIVNQRTNGPVNALLISRPLISTQHTNTQIKLAGQTLTLITHNPSFTHSVYYINQIPGHRMQ